MWRDPNPSAEVLLKRILTLLQKKEINPHLCADSFGIYGKKQTQELAVMVDTFKPLKITKQALNIEVKNYYKSWIH